MLPKYGQKCFSDYLRIKKLGNIIEEISMDDLANILYDFWVEIVPTETSTNIKIGDNNKENGVPRYTNTTLKCIYERKQINRYHEGS